MARILRLKFAADNREKTDLFYGKHGSSTGYGYGPADINNSASEKMRVWLVQNTSGLLRYFNQSVPGQSARNWLPDGVGPEPDIDHNITKMLSFGLNNFGEGGSKKRWPDVIVIQDSNNWAGYGVTNEQNILYIQLLVDEYRRRGAKVFVSSPLPRQSFTPDQRIQVRDAHLLMRARWGTQQQGNVRYIDYYDDLVDQDLAQKAEYRVASESPNFIHYNDNAHLNILFPKERDMFIKEFGGKPQVAHWEIEVASFEGGPFSMYNANVPTNVGYVDESNIDFYKTKWFRVRPALTAGGYGPYSPARQMTPVTAGLQATTVPATTVAPTTQAPTTQPPTTVPATTQAATTTIAPGTLNPVGKYLVDLGAADDGSGYTVTSPDDFGQRWNSWPGQFVAGHTKANLIRASDGAVSSIGIEWMDKVWGGIGGPGVNNAGCAVNVGTYPFNATKDSAFIEIGNPPNTNQAGVARIRIFGLHPNQNATAKLWAARNAPGPRATQFKKGDINAPFDPATVTWNVPADIREYDAAGSDSVPPPFDNGNQTINIGFVEVQLLIVRAKPGNNAGYGYVGIIELNIS